MTVEIARERVGGVLVANVAGRLDNESSADFELFVTEAVNAGERHLVLDVAGLGYISNAGMRALGSLAKSLATPTTSLRVAGVQPNVLQSLEAAGVAILLKLYVDRATALAEHPAARGDDLSAQLLKLLGVQPATAAAVTPAEAKLAELAMELLAGSQHHHRAARAIAQGTMVMKRVAGADAAPAPMLPAASKGANKKLGFWQRLFGRRG